MALTRDQLVQVALRAQQAGSLREAAADLRRTLPALRVSVVDALDMRGESPVLNLERCKVFLMQSDGHCWSVTRDPAEAVGIVLVEAEAA